MSFLRQSADGRSEGAEKLATALARHLVRLPATKTGVHWPLFFDSQKARKRNVCEKSIVLSLSPSLERSVTNANSLKSV